MLDWPVTKIRKVTLAMPTDNNAQGKLEKGALAVLPGIVSGSFVS